MSCYFCFVLLLEMNCGEYNVISLFVMCCSVNGSVYLVSCVFDNACKLFGKIICNIFGCGCYFVVQCQDKIRNSFIQAY